MIARGVWLLVAAGIAAGSLAGCGSTHARSSPPSATSGTGGTVVAPHKGTLSIAPAHPTEHSTISFGFTVPVATGVHGKYRISYSLSITGTGGPGCVGAHEAQPPVAAVGARSTIAIGPGQLGQPWCPGAYTARVIELRSANCNRSQPCPMFVGVVGIVAEAKFSVARS